MKLFLILILAVAGSQAISVMDVFKAEWQLYKLKYEKSYSSLAEELRRLEIFESNKNKIAEHNKRWAANEVTYELGINQFADMLPEEFEQLMLSSLTPRDNETRYFDNDNHITHIVAANVELPKEVDWRERGAVTAVKDQGNCGSCWAFAATGTLEGQHFRATKQLVSLSEQNLVDCAAARYYNYGCNGGWPDRALAYIMDNGGIDTDESYRYKAEETRCHFNRNTIGAKVRGVVYVPDDESALADAVATKGPVSVAIDASTLQLYHGGVLSVPYCTHNVNHAVLVVGYGHTKRGEDYWLVKNSWGKQWGESGYVRMARNKGNYCKIASFGVYPLV